MFVAEHTSNTEAEGSLKVHSSRAGRPMRVTSDALSAARCERRGDALWITRVLSGRWHPGKAIYSIAGGAVRNPAAGRSARPGSQDHDRPMADWRTVAKPCVAAVL